MIGYHVVGVHRLVLLLQLWRRGVREIISGEI